MKTLFKLHGVIVPVCIYFGGYNVTRVFTDMVIIKLPYYVAGQAGLKLCRAWNRPGLKICESKRARWPGRVKLATDRAGP